MLSLRDAAFEVGTKDENSTVKDKLLNILKDEVISDVIEGKVPDDIGMWFTQQELMPAVQAWARILWKYKGTSNNVDWNFMDEMDEIVKAGKSKNCKPIREINQELKDLFDNTSKGFTTVKSVFEYM